jgi:uncharacterized RDD family membrane protein YckC/cytoskeletal protein CcmA (bactofilin family)
MNINTRFIASALTLALVLGTARAGDTTVTVTANDASSASDASASMGHHFLKMHGAVFGSNDRTRVSIGHNQTLPGGEHADSVVSVMASSAVAGDVSEDVVSVMGNARVTGPVDGDVVVVLGNTYIDNKVGGDVVAVLGKIELGPNADVDGQVNAVGGTIVRDPASITRGDVEMVNTGMGDFDFAWLQNWVTNCLAKGRLLAFAPGLGWAWTVALVSLLFYALTALLMPRSIEKYVGVLESHPGESLLAAFLSVLATPILLVLLLITVIGAFAIPFLILALIVAASFGRIVLLAWIGTRLVKATGANGVWSHPAVTVLIGGLIVALLYAVPVVGMMVFQVIGFLGMGVVAYGLLLAMRSRGQSNAVPPQAAVASPPGAAPIPGAAAAASVAPEAAILGTTAAPAASLTSTPAILAAGTYPRAGFWIRMFALLIDVILIAILMHAVLDSSKSFFWVLLAIYGAVMWKLKGATLGGMICHLHVVRLDGRAVDWSTAIVRALGCFLSLFFAFLGFIWIVIDRENQAWHDKIAGTVVVRVPTGVSLV